VIGPTAPARPRARRDPGITRAQEGRVIFGDKTDVVRAGEFQIAAPAQPAEVQKPSIFERAECAPA